VALFGLFDKLGLNVNFWFSFMVIFFNKKVEMTLHALSAFVSNYNRLTDD